MKYYQGSERLIKRLKDQFQKHLKLNDPHGRCS